MHRIGQHLPPPLPPQVNAKPAKASDAARTLSGKTALDPFADLDEEYGRSDRARRRNDPNRFTDRRNLHRPVRQDAPEAFSGEIESLFAAALGTPKD